MPLICKISFVSFYCASFACVKWMVLQRRTLVARGTGQAITFSNHHSFRLWFIALAVHELHTREHSFFFFASYLCRGGSRAALASSGNRKDETRTRTRGKSKKNRTNENKRGLFQRLFASQNSRPSTQYFAPLYTYFEALIFFVCAHSFFFLMFLLCSFRRAALCRMRLCMCESEWVSFFPSIAFDFLGKFNFSSA